MWDLGLAFAAVGACAWSFVRDGFFCGLRRMRDLVCTYGSCRSFQLHFFKRPILWRAMQLVDPATATGYIQLLHSQLPHSIGGRRRMLARLPRNDAIMWLAAILRDGNHVSARMTRCRDKSAARKPEICKYESLPQDSYQTINSECLSSTPMLLRAAMELTMSLSARNLLQVKTVMNIIGRVLWLLSHRALADTPVESREKLQLMAQTCPET